VAIEVGGVALAIDAKNEWVVVALVRTFRSIAVARRSPEIASTAEDHRRRVGFGREDLRREGPRRDDGSAWYPGRESNPDPP